MTWNIKADVLGVWRLLRNRCADCGGHKERLDLARCDSCRAKTEETTL